MAIAHVQATGVATTSQVTSASATFSSTTAAGNLITIGLAYFRPSAHPTMTITDTFTNTWSQADTYLNVTSNITMAAFYAANIAAGASHQVTATPSATAFISFGISEYSGAATTSPLTATATGGPTTSNSPASASATVANANSMVWAVEGNNSGTADNTTAGTGFTLRFVSDTSGVADHVVTEDGLFSTNTAATFTITSNPTWGVIAGVFKPAATGGPFPHYTRRVLSGCMINMSGGVI